MNGENIQGRNAGDDEFGRLLLMSSWSFVQLKAPPAVEGTTGKLIG